MVQLNPLSLQSSQPSVSLSADVMSNKGIIIASIIFSLWAISLSLLLLINISRLPILFVVIAILWQTFLYTGLFITAHDAMHGIVYPKNSKVNHWIGKVALFIYGLFPYQELLKKHWLHHRYPGTKHDPDYYNYLHQNFFIWYLNFIKSYGKWTQLLGLMIIFNILKFGFHLFELNLTLFWIIPSLLSSAQLFYFGTFLPHRRLEEGHGKPHQIRTIALPIFWSFISCYHFGYHQEHHDYPNVPWWQLPKVYRNNQFL